MKLTTPDNRQSGFMEPNLTTSVRVGPYELPNRIIMAPLTRNRAGAGNVPQAMNVEYYAQRASAGLIITEATQISPQGIGYLSSRPYLCQRFRPSRYMRVTLKR